MGNRMGLFRKSADARRGLLPILAVRVGFEPTEPVKVQRFSRPPDSTALAPHRGFYKATPKRSSAANGMPCSFRPELTRGRLAAVPISGVAARNRAVTPPLPR